MSGGGGLVRDRGSLEQWLKAKPAVANLHDRYYSSIKRYIAERIDCPQDAEDIAQEVFLSICKHDPPSDPEAYVLAVARNLVDRHYRDEMKARQVAATILNKNFGAMRRTKRRGPVSMKQFERIIAHLDVNLSAKAREAIKLRFFDGLSCEEAAQRIGCSKGAVYKRLERAKRALNESIRSRG